MVKNNWFEQAYMNAEGEVDKLKLVAKLKISQAKWRTVYGSCIKQFFKDFAFAQL